MARWTIFFQTFVNLSEIHIIVILSSEIKVQDMPMEGDFMGDQDMPQPPQDNNQVKKKHLFHFENSFKVQTDFKTCFWRIERNLFLNFSLIENLL